jgi:hypothetical protein
MDTLLFWRTLNALDSSALRLSKHFDMLGQLRAFFAQIRPTFPDRAIKAVTDSMRLPATMDSTLAILQHLRAMMKGAANQETTVHIQQKLPDDRTRRENMSTKSAVAAAVASSLLIAGSHSSLSPALLLVSVGLVFYAGRAIRNA